MRALGHTVRAMHIPASILPASNVVLDADLSSKKRLLEEIARKLGGNDKQQQYIFEKLLERERLGSTALGHGIAIPHARINGLTQPTAAFFRLQDSIDFNSADGDPVDLVFALLVPEEATEEHLQLLAALAGKFSDEKIRERLRHVRSEAAIRAILTDTPTERQSA